MNIDLITLPSISVWLIISDRQQDEREYIRVFFDDLRYRLPCAVTRFGFHAYQDWRRISGRRLQPRGEFLGHARRHPVVGVRGGNQYRRIRHVVTNIVVWRVA